MMKYQLSRILLLLLSSIYLTKLLVIALDDQDKNILTTDSSGRSDPFKGDHKNDDSECKNINANLVKCEFNHSCVYGELNTVDCYVDEDTKCLGDKTFKKEFQCLYCWQLPEDKYTCASNSSCKVNNRYLTLCTTNQTTYCLGNREFKRYKRCNLESGHKWSTTVVLSILFGGFGVDRFYLGHWQEGVGKLFSFGGFGIWTLVDTILISIGYIKPADSSQYD